MFNWIKELRTKKENKSVVSHTEIINNESKEDPLMNSKDLYMDTYKEVAKSWVAADIKLSKLLEEELPLYSGQTSEHLKSFDYIENMDRYKCGIWLTGSLFYAKDYCYFRVNNNTKGQLLFSLKLASTINVIEFPSIYHPGDAIGKIINNVTPDVFISQNWEHILQELIKLDSQYSDVKGHIRREGSPNNMGIEIGGLSEVWICNKLNLVQVGDYVVPKTKSEFQKKYGNNALELPQKFFI
ncbi:hypothetical protein DS885_13775 [Psychromonas sp. B3M02]|uniref:hypothetical protein n=1 Tax=Psychromonas sp. B3M02 TaxID=2267226 RepID=UPI000DEADE6B|nr:hypothetical protein [Psychromonas sp. B3M02]RBW43207.1 hypothetical protein DS885_13775 [Psychromonas sp. B3M02]